jgi:hypothetical protein
VNRGGRRSLVCSIAIVDTPLIFHQFNQFPDAWPWLTGSEEIKNSSLFADLVADGGLLEERAEGCAEEYAQVSKAIDRLIRPYIDQGFCKHVKAKRWLNFADRM